MESNSPEKARQYPVRILRFVVALLGVAASLFVPTYAIGALIHAVFCTNRPGHPLLLYHYGIGLFVGLLIMRPALRELFAWALGRNSPPA